MVSCLGNQNKNHIFLALNRTFTFAYLQWQEVDVDELLRFIGLIIYMGFVKVSK